MGEIARADAPGDFCRLKNGLTHYRYFGPKTGALIVCIHGLTTPSFVFEALAEELAKEFAEELAEELAETIFGPPANHQCSSWNEYS